MHVQGTIFISRRHRAQRRISRLHREHRAPPRIASRVSGRQFPLRTLLHHSTGARRTLNYYALAKPPLRSATAPCALSSRSSLPRSPPSLAYLSRVGRARLAGIGVKDDRPSSIVASPPTRVHRAPPYRTASVRQLQFNMVSCLLRPCPHTSLSSLAPAFFHRRPLKKTYLPIFSNRKSHYHTTHLQ